MKFAVRMIASLFLFLFYSAANANTENAFYILHSNPKNIKELNFYLSTVKQHPRSIQLLIAQAYQIDDKGWVTGFINQELVDLTKTHSIKLMAMITNKGYDIDKVHQFLASQRAQQIALDSILSLCKKHHFYGVQFDFEMVSVNDKNALTQFYKTAAERLHKEGFRISYAIIPAFKTNSDSPIFLKRTYQNWSGAYDLKALGESSDFVTIMAYNQHPDKTIPGPNASIGYTEAAIKNSLKEIPANKLSLGIPAYSLYWHIGQSTVAVRQSEISYFDAARLIKKNHSPLIWSKKDKVNYVMYERNWLNEYIYLEDVDSFKAKLALAKKFKLRGISVFRIGTEDTRIWSFLQKPQTKLRHA